MPPLRGSSKQRSEFQNSKQFPFGGHPLPDVGCASGNLDLGILGLRCATARCVGVQLAPSSSSRLRQRSPLEDKTGFGNKADQETPVHNLLRKRRELPVCSTPAPRCRSKLRPYSAPSDVEVGRTKAILLCSCHCLAQGWEGGLLQGSTQLLRFETGAGRPRSHWSVPLASARGPRPRRSDLLGGHPS